MLNGLSLNIDKGTLKLLKRLGWAVILFTIAALVVSAMERKSQSEAREVLIAIEPLEGGESLISDTDVRLAITRNLGYQLEGRKIASIDVERLEEMLESESFILNADVFISANNQVSIDIQQRVPVLRIIDNNGENYYLDQNGVQVPLSKHFTTKVLVATGSLPAYDEKFQKRKRSRMKDAFELAQLILADDFLQPMIEQMHFSPKGIITLVPKLGNHKITFGKYENAEDKLKRLKAFYKEALPYEGWRKYSSISLEYKGQVVGKKR
ncbi:MAG: hypothetical protein MI974_05430 [Chitinophagales bacterium]|nr:hypothetical protein [Chitinophagales bacterium]